MPQWSTYFWPVEYCINIVASLNIAGGRGTTRVGRGFKCGYRIHVLVFVPNLQRNIQFFSSISHSTQIVIYTSNLNDVYPSVCRLWISGLILFYFSVYVSTDPAIVFFLAVETLLLKYYPLPKITKGPIWRFPKMVQWLTDKQTKTYYFIQWDI